MTDEQSASRTDWWIPASLLLLSAVPALAGAIRLRELAGGVPAEPNTAHFFATPLPLVLHIVGATLFAVVGAFQFPPGLRRRWPRWHRISGRLLVASGLVGAFSGLWMVQFYPPINFDGPILYVIRLIAGSAMALFLCLGVVAIRRRDIPAHRAWMMRAYALALGAGTQVFTHLPLLVIPPDERTRALAMGAGWAINLVVAEWLIRSASSVRRASPSAVISAA